MQGPTKDRWRSSDHPRAQEWATTVTSADEADRTSRAPRQAMTFAALLAVRPARRPRTRIRFPAISMAQALASKLRACQ